MTDRIKEVSEEILSKAWYTLRRYTYQWKTFRGPWQEQCREVYDRGNGVAVLMVNRTTKKVLLLRQLRFPTWLNGNNNGLLLEVPAGVLDSTDPEACMIREIEEETGYQAEKLTRLFEVYTSPGALTEKLYFFFCDYSTLPRINEGGGSTNETEDLLVEEYSFSQVREMVLKGKINDAKTLLLLQHGIMNELL